MTRNNDAKLSASEMAALDMMIAEMQERGERDGAKALAVTVVARVVGREVVRAVVREVVRAVAGAQPKAGAPFSPDVIKKIEEASKGISYTPTLDDLLKARRAAIEASVDDK